MFTLRGRIVPQIHKQNQLSGPEFESARISALCLNKANFWICMVIEMHTNRQLLFHSPAFGVSVTWMAFPQLLWICSLFSFNHIVWPYSHSHSVFRIPNWVCLAMTMENCWAGWMNAWFWKRQFYIILYSMYWKMQKTNKQKKEKCHVQNAWDIRGNVFIVWINVIYWWGVSCLWGAELGLAESPSLVYI